MSDHRRNAAAAAHATGMPSRLVISHAVPPFTERQAVREAAVPQMSLTADRTRYVVRENEFPTYGITGAEPNQTILWSLWQNGVNVVDDQPFGKATDGEGTWFGVGSAWSAEQEGFWVVRAKTGERQASIRFVVSADSATAEPVPPDAMLGVAHVAGRYRFATPDSELAVTSFLVEGARHVLNLGVRNLFAYLTPQYRSDYPFDSFADTASTSLTALAGSRAYQELFSLPFETFVLTMYTFANWPWMLRRGSMDAVAFDADGEREEVAELAGHLLTSYPDKRFILKNWEGDWQLKMSYDADAVPSEPQIADFIEWMRARQAGIMQVRGDPQDQRVRHAIEFNLIHQVQRGLPSMLASVVPQVDSDLLAYSSWWSLARAGDRARNVSDDITFIRSLPGIRGRPVMVSEFGVSYVEPEPGRRTAEAVGALSLAGVPMALYWQIFDNGPDVALVGPEATRFESWHTLRAFLRSHNDASFVHEETSLPQQIITGQQYPVAIAIRNSGNLFDPVVGYALGLLDAEGKLQQVVWVRREVAEGEVVILEFVLNTPATAGPYFFRMFQHGVELFGEEMPIEVHADSEANMAGARSAH